MTNPYDVLGLPETATEADVKEAWKRLAKAWHPDRNRSSAETQRRAQQRFAEVNAAAQVLLDPEARAAYDRTRADFFGAEPAGPAPAPGAPPPWTPARQFAVDLAGSALSLFLGKAPDARDLGIFVQAAKTVPGFLDQVAAKQGAKRRTAATPTLVATYGTEAQAAAALARFRRWRSFEQTVQVEGPTAEHSAELDRKVARLRFRAEARVLEQVLSVLSSGQPRPLDVEQGGGA